MSSHVSHFHSLLSHLKTQPPPSSIHFSFISFFHPIVTTTLTHVIACSRDSSIHLSFIIISHPTVTTTVTHVIACSRASSILRHPYQDCVPPRVEKEPRSHSSACELIIHFLLATFTSIIACSMHFHSSCRHPDQDFPPSFEEAASL